MSKFQLPSPDALSQLPLAEQLSVLHLQAVRERSEGSDLWAAWAGVELALAQRSTKLAGPLFAEAEEKVAAVLGQPPAEPQAYFEAHILRAFLPSFRARHTQSVADMTQPPLIQAQLGRAIDYLLSLESNTPRSEWLRRAVALSVMSRVVLPIGYALYPASLREQARSASDDASLAHDLYLASARKKFPIRFTERHEPANRSGIAAFSLEDVLGEAMAQVNVRRPTDPLGEIAPMLASSAVTRRNVAAEQSLCTTLGAAVRAAAMKHMK